MPQTLEIMTETCLVLVGRVPEGSSSNFIFFLKEVQLKSHYLMPATELVHSICFYLECTYVKDAVRKMELFALLRLAEENDNIYLIVHYYSGKFLHRLQEKKHMG